VTTPRFLTKPAISELNVLLLSAGSPNVSPPDRLCWHFWFTAIDIVFAGVSFQSISCVVTLASYIRWQASWSMHLPVEQIPVLVLIESSNRIQHPNNVQSFLNVFCCSISSSSSRLPNSSLYHHGFYAKHAHCTRPPPCGSDG
jgi:hypothetical protein